MKPPSKMRWTEQDEETFRKLRKNYNAKIERIRKSQPELIQFLPTKLRKENIYSRKDFEVAQKYGEMFLKKDSKKMTPIAKGDSRKVPKFFKEQLDYVVKRENRRRKELEKKLTPEKGTYSLRSKADVRQLKTNPKGRQTKPHKQLEELSLYKQAIEGVHLWDSNYIKNAERYRENYIKELNKTVSDSSFAGTGDLLTQPIEELLRSMSVAGIFKAYQDYDMKLYLKFLYDIQDAARETKVLYLSWCSYLGRQPKQVYLDRYDRIINGQDYQKTGEGQ